MENLRAKLLKHLGLQTFVVVDLETTGLDPEKNRIIEIGAIRFEDGVEVDAMDELIDPGVPIPEFITRLTGISDTDVAGKPKIDDVFPRLEQFIGDAAFVGQQVNFDASFLEYHYRHTNNDFQNWENQAQRFKYLKNFRLDTLFIARILMPFQDKFKLGDLASYFGYNLENAHQAVEDARATAHVFLHLLDRVLAVDNVSLSNIINLLFANSRRAKSFFVPVLNFKNQHHISITSQPLIDDAKLSGQFFNVMGKLDKAVSIPEEEPIPELVDERDIEHYFSPDGKLAKVIPNYEDRPEQREMARTITSAFNQSAFVVAEAGTGTGKSMAYLAPAMEWASRNRHIGQRTIISTNTKNLQEQLFFKDIPTLFTASGGGFSAVLLKGRGNYLCLDKWHAVMTDVNQRLSNDERSRVLPLVLWVKQTKTGDIAENAGFQLERNIGLWSKFIAESSYCPGKACKYYQECFLMKARRDAQKADLVVVNHSLLLSDLAADHAALNEYRSLVIDEAHNLENAAAEYLGVRVNFWAFRNLYHKLYEEDKQKSGTLVQLEFRMSRGKQDEQKAKEIIKISRALKVDSNNLKNRVLIFYNELSRQLKEKYSAKNGSEENRIRYHKNFRYFNLLSQQSEDIKSSVKSILSRLTQLVDKLNRLKADSFEFQDQLLRELISIHSDFTELLNAFDFCLKAEEEKFVYWLEIPRHSKSNDVVMRAVPLNIAELLKKRLFDELDTAVLVSATLTVDKRFDYFIGRTGLNLLEEKELITRSYGSPFDYPRQLMVGVTDFMPDPRNERFMEALAESIKNLHRQHRTGMLVLFTSYGMLNRIHDLIKPHFDGERVLLLTQGKGQSRTHLINQFREFRDSILLGTDSFWEGVDVPGDALELLIIPKLPFDVPSDPVVEARMEEIKKSGGNPFFDYSVPEAIIKFRQGFGRLIRSKSDFGTVLVTDNRLSKMRYGQQFLNSLPVPSTIFYKQDEMLQAVRDWFVNKETNQPLKKSRS